MTKFELTWEPKKVRWRKIYRGQLYTVSCASLDAPPNKVDSYQAAKEWWRLKRAEIDSAPAQPIPQPHRRVAKELSDRLAWTQTTGQKTLAKAIKSDQEVLADLEECDGSLADQLLGGTDARAVWAERFSSAPSAPPTDRTIGHHVDRWIDLQKVKARAGEFVPAEAENRKHGITFFATWIGRDVPIDAITESKWSDFYAHILKQLTEKSLSRSYSEKLLRYARQFVASLDDERLIIQPRNLLKLKVKQRTQTVEVMPIEVARRLIRTATGQLRLHLTLMANCGMTQQDISDLHPGEFDGRHITRKRSKTKDHEDVPTVRYKLWPETTALIQEYRSKDPERLLVTVRGLPWVKKEYVDGKFVEADSIRTNYSRHAKEQGVTLSLKYFRKTSATLLDREKRWGDRVSSLFLGHSPRSLKDKHYTPTDDHALDEALDWLHDQYFKTKEGG